MSCPIQRRPARARGTLAAALIFSACGLARSQTCSPMWLPGWDGIDQGPILGLAEFDTGSGPHLYAAASQQVLRWDSERWASIGAADGTIGLLRTFTLGGDTSLYAAGLFTTIDGVPASRMARWNGAAWNSLGSNLNGAVYATAVYDDGSGPSLYIGGAFVSAGAQTVNRMARWTGTDWAPVGAGLNGAVRSLESCTVAGITSLYAGGDFVAGGTVVGDHIARWNGSVWLGVGGGLHQSVTAMASYAGSLYVGRQSALVNRWDGTSWSPAATGSGSINLMRAHDDGSGPKLWVFGQFSSINGVSASNAASWDGESWSPAFSGTILGGLYAAEWDSSAPSEPLYIGGDFSQVGNAFAFSLAKVEGSVASPVTGASVDNSVLAMALADLGGGTDLYVGGALSYAGHTPASHVARWDGSGWSALGDGTDGPVRAIAQFNDPAGPALYVGGQFSNAGGVPASSIVRWNGSFWSALGSGLQGDSPNYAFSLLPFDDGSGPALYVGGRFRTAGGVPARSIARWTGTAWQPVGGDCDGSVSALAVYNDGRGPALYAAGAFTMIGGVPANSIARWNGSTWSALDPVGTAGNVFALVVYDDGTGPGLYAGGSFGFMSTIPHTQGVARWDGTSWSPLGLGVDTSAPVRSLITFDDGSGEALYAVGDFNSVSGTPVLHVARWKDFVWSNPTAGGLGPNNSSATCAAHFGDLGNVQQIVVGGSFSTAGGVPSFDMARLTGCPICYANCDHSTMPPTLNVLDFSCFLNSFAAGSPYANCDQSTTPPVLNVNDFQCFINRFAAGCP